MKFIDRVNTKLSRILMYLSLILTFLIVYGVLARYLIGRADARVIFTSVWLYGILFVLGGGYTLLEGGHVSVDIIYKKLPEKAKKVLDILNYAMIIACCAIIIYISLPLAYQSFLQREVDSSLGIVFAPPIWWFKWIPVIGLALMLLQAISLMKEVFKR